MEVFWAVVPGKCLLHISSYAEFWHCLIEGPERCDNTLLLQSWSHSFLQGSASQTGFSSKYGM